MQKGHQLSLSEQSEVEFQIGWYKDKVVGGIMPMDLCRLILGWPREFDRKVVHDGDRNTHKFKRDCIKHTLVPFEQESTTRTSRSKAFLLGKKESSQQMERIEESYVAV